MKPEKSATTSKETTPLYCCRLSLQQCRLWVIGVAILQLCGTTGVARRMCPVYREEFTALDNSTCLPKYYEDINQPTEECYHTVRVLLSCLCVENAGHPPGAAVGNGRYCLSNVTRTGEYTANLSIGVCVRGLCNSSAFFTKLPVDLRDERTAEVLNLTVLPRCTRQELQLTDTFRPLASCEFFCGDRGNMPLNDGSTCAMDWGLNVFRQLRVGITGRCRNGYCLVWPHENPRDLGCIDQEAIMSPTGTVSSCTYQCGKKMVQRENGLTCVLEPGTFWTPATVGVCFEGVCTEIAEVNNDPPDHVDNKVTVGQRCFFVKNWHLMQRNDGDLCVLQRSRFTGAPQLVGVCSRGDCIKRPPYGPPAQNFNLKDCEVRNVQITENLIVAESCVATCRDYRTQNRLDGTPCLFRYRSFSCYVFRTCETYSVGQCFRGNCIDSQSGWDIHF